MENDNTKKLLQQKQCRQETRDKLTPNACAVKVLSASKHKKEPAPTTTETF